MLFIFRQLRRLELRQKSGRYFLYAFGEIVLIVIGIVIAVQIGNWNQGRAEGSELRSQLTTLKVDFQQNLVDLDDIVGKATQQLEEAEHLREVLKGDAIQEDPSMLNRYMINVLAVWTIKQTTKSYDELLSSGYLSNIENASLKAALGAWKTQFEYVRRIEGDGLGVRDNSIWPVYIDALALGDTVSEATVLGDTFKMPKGRFRNDFEALAEDRRIDNALVVQILHIRDSLYQWKELRTYILEINQLLDEELRE